MKILSFGSLNYDYTYEVEHFLAPKETLAAKSMQRGFGGKGANQSIAFARLSILSQSVFSWCSEGNHHS